MSVSIRVVHDDDWRTILQTAYQSAPWDVNDGNQYFINKGFTEAKWFTLEEPGELLILVKQF